MTTLTKEERIRAHLAFHGITEPIVIDEGAEDHLLTLLESEALIKVELDEEGALILDLGDEE